MTCILLSGIAYLSTFTCFHMSIAIFVLQLAKAVDVIGSREVTPVPEEGLQWVSEGQVQAELEELSRTSRKFLEVSRQLNEVI